MRDKDNGRVTILFGKVYRWVRNDDGTLCLVKAETF